MIGSIARELSHVDPCRSDSHTVCHNDAIFALNSFVGDSFREVDRKKDRVHLPPYWIERGFEKHFSRKSALDPAP